MSQSPSRIGQIASYRGALTSPAKKLAQLRVGVADKEPAQIFARLALRKIPPQQPLERIRHFRGRAAISDRARRSLVQAERSAHAEVVGIDHGGREL